MHKKLHSILCIAALASIFASVGFAASRQDKSADSRHVKARYYYIEGSVALAEGRTPEAYELIKKAAETDPEYTEAAYNYALIRMSMRNDTLQSQSEVQRSIAMMRPFVEQYPEEFTEAMNYSYLAARSGDIDEAIRVAERTDSLAPDLTGTLLQLMQYYSVKQDYEKAINALNRYERIEGNDPEITLRKFAFMLSKGDTLGLISENQRLVEENPVNPEYLLIKGNVFEAIEMPDSALAVYKKAETLAPDDGRTKLILANFYLQEGDSAAYDLKSREALLSDNIMLDEKLEMMSRYMHNILTDSADTSRGTRLFDGLLAQYPHEPMVLDLGAQYFSAINNMPRAEELMAYATDLDPDNPNYWLRLTTFYHIDEKYPQAIATAEKAIEKLGKDTPEALFTVYSAAALMDGEYDKAMNILQTQLDSLLPGALLSDSVNTVLEKAANLDYESLMKLASIYGLTGDCYSKIKDYPEAIRIYEICIALDPSNLMSINNYAYFLALESRDLDKAEEYSRKTVEEQPENPTYLDTLAYILYLKGEYAEALSIQEKAVEKLEDTSESEGEYWDHLGDIQYKMGLKDKALENWEKAKANGCDNKNLPEKIRTKKLIE